MWDVIKLNVGCIFRSIFLSFGVVVFKNHEDGLRAIDELNGYESSGGRKLRVDCLYPSCGNGEVLEERHRQQAEMDCLPSPPWITVPGQGERFQLTLEV
jgi:hypothetical protein